MNHLYIDPARIRQELACVLQSPQFRDAGRLRDFLQFIVVETIAGRSSYLKEYLIGTTVYGRRRSFNPKQDAIVRVEAVKLRKRLEQYYFETGSAAEVVIDVPKGAYVPEFSNRGPALVCGPTAASHITELCDVGYLAVLRRTPTSVAVANRCFLQASTLNPDDPRPYRGLATCYSASLDIETVAASDITTRFDWCVSQALKLDPDCAEAHVLASLRKATWIGTGRSAVVELTRAFDLDRQNPVAHFWATALCSAEGKHDECLGHFREAIRRAPDCPLIRAYLGRAHYYAGRNQDAIAALKDVSHIDPSLAVAYLWAALAHSELGQHDEAIEAGTKAVRFSETTAALATCAYVSARAGRREDAAGILSRLVDTPYGDYVSPLQLAVIYQALGLTRQAAVHFANARRARAWGLLWRRVDPRLQRLPS